MDHLEAVDAKLERARGQLRRLREEAGEFCRERSRLILPEECGPEECGPEVGVPGRRERSSAGVVDTGWGIGLQPAIGPGPVGVAVVCGPRELRRRAR